MGTARTFKPVPLHNPEVAYLHASWSKGNKAQSCQTSGEKFATIVREKRGPRGEDKSTKNLERTPHEKARIRHEVASFMRA